MISEILVPENKAVDLSKVAGVQVEDKVVIFYGFDADDVQTVECASEERALEIKNMVTDRFKTEGDYDES